MMTVCLQALWKLMFITFNLLIMETHSAGPKWADCSWLCSNQWIYLEKTSPQLGAYSHFIDIQASDVSLNRCQCPRCDNLLTHTGTPTGPELWHVTKTNVNDKQHSISHNDSTSITLARRTLWRLRMNTINNSKSCICQQFLLSEITKTDPTAVFYVWPAPKLHNFLILATKLIIRLT